MAVNAVKTGWQADFRPEGKRGPRIRRTFKKKRDAENFEIQEKAKALKGNYSTPSKDDRRLSELVESWYDLHGHTLNSGKERKQKLKWICKELSDPLAKSFKSKHWLEYQLHRMEDKALSNGKIKKGTSRNNMRHELAYLKAVFNTLIDANDWPYENPLSKVKPLKIAKRHPFFLQFDQVEKLLVSLGAGQNKDVLIISKICLSTGCRWGEVQYLNGEDVHNGRVHFQETKNSLARSVPIDEDLEREIFKKRPRSGQLFKSARKAFELAIIRAEISLPRGTLTHVLRHTFASHFMMGGGDLLQLNKILGHQTIQMTMVYAHLAPKYLESAKENNPLKQIAENRKKILGGHNVDAIT